MYIRAIRNYFRHIAEYCEPLPSNDQRGAAYVAGNIILWAQQSGPGSTFDLSSSDLQGVSAHREIMMIALLLGGAGVRELGLEPPAKREQRDRALWKKLAHEHIAQDRNMDVQLLNTHQQVAEQLIQKNTNIVAAVADIAEGTWEVRHHDVAPLVKGLRWVETLNVHCELTQNKQRGDVGHAVN